MGWQPLAAAPKQVQVAARHMLLEGLDRKVASRLRSLAGADEVDQTAMQHGGNVIDEV